MSRYQIPPLEVSVLCSDRLCFKEPYILPSPPPSWDKKDSTLSSREPTSPKFSKSSCAKKNKTGFVNSILTNWKVRFRWNKNRVINEKTKSYKLICRWCNSSGSISTIHHHTLGYTINVLQAAGSGHSITRCMCWLRWTWGRAYCISSTCTVGRSRWRVLFPLPIVLCHGKVSISLLCMPRCKG